MISTGAVVDARRASEVGNHHDQRVVEPAAHPCASIHTPTAKPWHAFDCPKTRRARRTRRGDTPNPSPERSDGGCGRRVRRAKPGYSVGSTRGTALRSWRNFEMAR